MMKIQIPQWQRLAFLLAVILFGGVLAVNAQQKIQGTVTDAQSGETLPGVNIVIKGTDQGTSTNAKGLYELQVTSLQDTLVFSFIGFGTKKIPIQNRTSIDIALKSQTLAGDEVLVLGYTTTTQNSVVGSVNSIEGDQLQEQATSDVVEMLKGKSTGIYVAQGQGDPGAEPQMLIRGIGSISAGSSPLYVIDGIISDTYTGVNSNDIASLNVLKGPSATAIYGSRAANGVVVITTKDGKVGETQINVNASSGVARALKGNLDMMNAQEFYDFYQEVGIEPPVNQNSMTNTDWWDTMFDPAWVNNYQVSASKGTEDGSFYVSGNYYKENGTLRTTDNKKLQLRANAERKFSEYFKVETRLTGSVEKNNYESTGNGLFASVLALPWDDPINENGEPVQAITGVNWLSRDVRNPLYANQWNFDRDKTNYFAGDFNLIFDFTDNLNFTSNNRITYNFTQYEEYNDPRTIYGSSNNGALYNSSYRNNLITTSNLLNY